jgi:flagellar protein FlgJ
MHISALQQPHINPANVPLEKLAADPNVSDKDKVAEACRQFEAVLLRQILQETRKTVIASTETPDDATASGIYNDMVNSQLADKISRSGEFGLAKSLQAQLIHQVLPGVDAGRAKAGLTPIQPINSPKIKP